MQEPRDIPRDNYLDRFYFHLADEDVDSIQKLGIPMSDVFYIRAAVKERTGIEFPLSHIERQIKEFRKYG